MIASHQLTLLVFILVGFFGAITLLAQFTDPASTVLHTGAEAQGKRGTLGAVEFIASDRLSTQQYCDIDGRHCLTATQINALLQSDFSEVALNQQTNDARVSNTDSGLSAISWLVPDVVRNAFSDSSDAQSQQSAGRSCLFNGQPVADGDAVLAYHDDTIPVGATCLPQERVCLDGTLTGNFQYDSCDGIMPQQIVSTIASDAATGEETQVIQELRGSLQLQLETTDYVIGSSDSFNRAEALAYCNQFETRNPTVRYDCFLDPQDGSQSVQILSGGVSGSSINELTFPDSDVVAVQTGTAGCIDPTADNYDATATISGECEYVISNPDWNTSGGFTAEDGTVYEGWDDNVNAAFANAYCVYAGYDRSVDTKTIERAGELQYSCSSPGSKSLANCNPCWEEPWASGSCTTLAEATCAIDTDAASAQVDLVNTTGFHTGEAGDSGVIANDTSVEVATDSGQIPQPACTLTASQTEVSGGSQVTISIKTSNADDATVHHLRNDGQPIEERSLLGSEPEPETFLIRQGSDFHMDVWRHNTDGSVAVGSCQTSVRIVSDRI